MKITHEPIAPPTDIERHADRAMRPLMYVLGGFKRDSIQETHPWHQQPIDPLQVDPELSVFVTGEKEALNARLGPLFHMFGG